MGSSVLQVVTKCRDSIVVNAEIVQLAVVDTVNALKDLQTAPKMADGLRIVAHRNSR